METVSTEVTLIRRRNDIEKSTWRTHRYFVDFESRIHVEISTLNRCHNFHMDSPFKIDVISTKFPRGISTSNRWRIDEDVSIGHFHHHENNDIHLFLFILFFIMMFIIFSILSFPSFYYHHEYHHHHHHQYQNEFLNGKLHFVCSGMP